MSGLEGTTASADSVEAQPMDAGRAYPIEHAPVTEQGEYREGNLEQTTTGDSGFRNRPLKEFRAQHEGEFLQPNADSYPVERFGDPDRLVSNVNPEFGDPNGRYDVNCADCARSVERGWRGDHEEAAGRLTQFDSEGNALDGEFPDETEQWAGEKFAPVSDTEEFRERLQAGGHGSSAIVHTQYTFDGEPGGHAYNVVNHEGELRVLDGQSGESFPWADQKIYSLGENQQHTAMAWNGKGERLW